MDLYPPLNPNLTHSEERPTSKAILTWIWGACWQLPTEWYRHWFLLLWLSLILVPSTFLNIVPDKGCCLEFGVFNTPAIGFLGLIERGSISRQSWSFLGGSVLWGGSKQPLFAPNNLVASFVSLQVPEIFYLHLQFETFCYSELWHQDQLTVLLFFVSHVKLLL